MFASQDNLHSSPAVLDRHGPSACQPTLVLRPVPVPPCPLCHLHDNVFIILTQFVETPSRPPPLGARSKVFVFVLVGGTRFVGGSSIFRNDSSPLPSLVVAFIFLGHIPDADVLNFCWILGTSSALASIFVLKSVNTFHLLFMKLFNNSRFSNFQVTDDWWGNGLGLPHFWSLERNFYSFEMLINISFAALALCTGPQNK